MKACSGQLMTQPKKDGGDEGMTPYIPLGLAYMALVKRNVENKPTKKKRDDTTIY
jgi:hypothetical protein